MIALHVGGILSVLFIASVWSSLVGEKALGLLAKNEVLTFCSPSCSAAMGCGGYTLKGGTH